MGRLLRRRGMAGVTLLELAGTLMVFTIVLGAAVNFTSPIPGSLQWKTATETKEFLLNARSRAVSTGRTVYVSFSSAGAAACWTSDCPAAGGGGSPVLDTFGSPVALVAPSALSISGGPSAMTFSPLGRPTGWADVTVGTAVIGMDPATGRPR